MTSLVNVEAELRYHASAGRRFSILTDVPLGKLGTGVRRRYEHIAAALEKLGVEYDQQVLLESPSHSVTSGVIAAWKHASRPGLQDDSGVVICVGLSSPYSVVVARHLALKDNWVVFDHCDSVVMQEAGAMVSGSLRTIVWTTFRFVMALLLPRRVLCTYISERDRQLDRVMNLIRRSGVISASAPDVLSRLPEVNMSQLNRIIIPGGFDSPHLRHGLKMLRDALNSEPLPPGFGLEFETFGNHAEKARLPPIVQHNGRVPSLEDIYRGDCVVFIANVRGAGVPNKLVEAGAARRPVIVHTSVVRRVSVPLRGWSFRTQRDLKVVLANIAAGDLPRPL